MSTVEQAGKQQQVQKKTSDSQPAGASRVSAAVGGAQGYSAQELMLKPSAQPGFAEQTGALRPDSVESKPNVVQAKVAPAPQVQAKGAPVKTPSTTPDFDKYAAGSVKKADAPESMKLPSEMTTGMKTAWDGSFPEAGKDQEQGGIMVRNADGSYEWKKGATGTTATFSPNYGDVGTGQSLVASGHTHPYHTGEKDVSFSGGDLANLVWQKERVKIVRSGDSLFVVTKTEEFDKLVESKTEDQKEKLQADMQKLWTDTFYASTGNFQASVEEAVKAVCTRYHLIYYKGKDETVTRVK